MNLDEINWESVDVDVDEDGLLFIEEIDESAKIEAMNDIEEGYESIVVDKNKRKPVKNIPKVPR